MASAAGNWKDRFTEEQLERKRTLDRVSRKKSRQRSKEVVAELEHRLRLALDGDHGTLINRLIDENARLQAKVDFYKSRLQSIVQAGQECLDSDDETSPLAPPPPNPSPPPSHSNNDGSTQIQIQPLAPRAQHEPCKPEVPHELLAFNFTPPSCSFLHQTFSFSPLATPSHYSSEPRPMDVINSITNLKVVHHKGNPGFDFIIQHMSITSNPRYIFSSDLEKAALSNTIFQDILERLLYDGPECIAKSREPASSPDAANQKIPGEAERQRRAAAICACENIRRWRSCFKSDKEYIAIFWAQYRYFLFLTFPTLENFSNLLPWQRPRPAQFTSNHPAYVDFLVWPQLREYLSHNWQKYNARDLLISLMQTFDISGPIADDRPLIKLKPDMSDLELDASYQGVIENLEYFSTEEKFCLEYPELRAFVNIDRSAPGSQQDRRQYETDIPTPVTSIQSDTASQPLKRSLTVDPQEEAPAAAKRPHVPVVYADPGMTGDFENWSYPPQAQFSNGELANMASVATMECMGLSGFLATAPTPRPDYHGHWPHGSQDHHLP